MELSNRKLELKIGDNHLENYFIDVNYQIGENENNSTCSITIHNYEQKVSLKDEVIVRAGYDNNIEDVYIGNIVDYSYDITDNDSNLSIIIEDSFIQKQKINTPEKITKETSIVDLIKKIIKHAGLKEGKIELDINLKTTNNYTIYTYPLKLLNRLAKKYKFRYVIEKGAVNILKNPKGNEMYVLDFNSGLLKYSYGERFTENGKQKFLNIESMYLPNIRLNEFIKIEDNFRQIKKLGIITNISVNLSNYSNNWYMRIEAEEK